MHPNRRFHWDDEAAILAFVNRIGFATICVDGPAVAHTPVVADPGRLRFHIARGNPAAKRFAGRALVSVLGPDAYVSPDWYGTPDQVPTWNYVAVEAEGLLSPLDEAGTLQLLDDLAIHHEAPLAPKVPWTRAKTDPAYVDKLLKGIIGFALDVDALRGTRKLGQTKSDPERIASADAMAATGRADMADLMREGLA